MTTEEPPFDYGAFDEGSEVNYWRLEPALAREARRVFPADEYEWAATRLGRFGGTVGKSIAENADVVDDHAPTLRTLDRHGDPLNRVDYHPAQLENERLAYESGLVADAFEAPPDRDEPAGLLYPLTMQLLLCYADVGLACPVSMTAGAALVLRNHDDAGHYDDFLAGLTARSYEDVVQGAMFLTEEQGGSDVGATETVADPAHETSAPIHDVPADRVYELTGEKWFCSNIDGQGTLALARRPDAPEGTDGLSLFLVPHELADGSLNRQRYRRLKDKLGTVSVPTGEVEFEDTVGYLVGDPERGFRYMTTMLNYERVTNATGAVGVIGRALLESKIHAADREAFGQSIAEYPLMRRDLVDMQVNFEAALAFSMEAARYLDRYERGHEGGETTSDHEGGDANSDQDDREAFRLMRALVPVAKHRTGRMAIDAASYAMEIQGGNGYVSDFVTHRLLRDAQVLPIWEGTSNILSLDLLRAFETVDAHEALVPLVDDYLDEVEDPVLTDTKALVRSHHETLQAALLTLSTEDDAYAQQEAKELADLVFDVVTAAILLAKAQRRLDEDGDAREAAVAKWFVGTTLETREGRGILDGDALPLDCFDAVVRYDRLDPGTLTD